MSSSSCNFDTSSPYSLFLPDATKLTGSLRSSFPLKRKYEEMNHSGSSQSVKRVKIAPSLYSNASEKKQRAKLKVNSIKFRQQPPSEDASKYTFFVHFKAQFDLIEKYLQECQIPPLEVSLIRSEIERICSNGHASENRKLAELGLLHYYLMTKKPFPTQESFLEDRILEITTNAAKLRSQHVRIFGKKKDNLTSSGTIDYLLRTFAKMVFTPDGGFNLGGCCAIKEILSTSVSLYLSEEMRTQILNIVDRLINDEGLRSQFKGPFDIHPDLEDLIRKDIKLSKEEETNYVYVRWALLIFLFSLPGQDGEPNCFVIAPAINLWSNYPERILKVLLYVLRGGYLFLEGNRIPVLPLFESKRSAKDVFDITVAKASSMDICAFSVACEALGVKPDLQSVQSETLTLENLFDIAFGSSSKEAKEIFISHRKNRLQQLMISVLQFVGLNRTAKNVENPSTAQTFIEGVKKSIVLPYYRQATGIVNYNYMNTFKFIDDLGQVLKSEIFFIDHKSHSQMEKDSRIVFDFHTQGLKKIEGLNDAASFRLIRRLYKLDQGRLIPLDSLTAVQRFLEEAVDKVPAATHQLRAFRDDFKQLIASNTTKQVLATMLSHYNARRAPDIGSQHYLDSDSFFVIQDGGWAQTIMDWDPFNDLFEHREIDFRGGNEQSCFRDICQKIDAWAQTKLKSPQGTNVLIQNSRHVFTLGTDRFSEYTSSQDQMQREILDPADEILNKSVPITQRSYILKKFLGNIHGEEITLSLPPKPMKMRRFINEVNLLLSLEKREAFNQEINVFLEKIDPDEFIGKIIKILSSHGISVEEENEDAFLKLLKKSSDGDGYLPYQWANLIHQLLLKGENPIFVHRFHLEQTIRRFFSLPQVVDLGSFNWVTKKSETEEHIRFVVYFDYAKGGISFGRKEHTRGASPLDKDFADSLMNSGQLVL